MFRGFITHGVPKLGDEHKFRIGRDFYLIQNQGRNISLLYQTWFWLCRKRSPPVQKSPSGDARHLRWHCNFMKIHRIICIRFPTPQQSNDGVMSMRFEIVLTKTTYSFSASPHKLTRMWSIRIGTSPHRNVQWNPKPHGSKTKGLITNPTTIRFDIW